MALKSYRNIAAKKNILGWKKNEIIIPASAHVAFEKGADLLGLKVKKADLDANYQVDLKHVEKLISSRTMLLVGSAPQYPHGVVDNIEGLSDLAIKNRLPLHVDGCLGGYFLPWLEKIGHDIPVFDFRL
jgi:glutamate/tyrosine decarboxylase-like PLP-dependent enzyme